jgi:UTP--glucose-1-phosphate uridylyltransferase
MQRARSGVIKAVIPAAGFGSRMMPLTKVIPKEMLPVGSKPMIQHAVEEAVASGIKQIGIVIRQGKEIIKDHFTLRSPVGGKGAERAAELEALMDSCELTFIYQKRPLGLGDALLEAKDFVGEESFVMMIPDQQLHDTVPATAQLLRRWQPGPTIWSSLLRLPKVELPFFIGARGVRYTEKGAGEILISGLSTEEETERTHRGLSYEVRGFGRTIYPPQIFDYLGAEFINPQSGEVDLAKTFEKCTEKLEIRGTWLAGDAFDLGTFRGYYRYLPKLWELEQRDYPTIQAGV